MGADAVFVDKHATGWSADPGAGGNLAGSCLLSGDQPTLPRPVDRLDPADNAGRAGPWLRISLDRPRLLFGRHRDWIRHRVGDQTLRQAKIGEGFWPLGFATAVLIKPILGNGDLESSQ